jgi:deltex
VVIIHPTNQSWPCVLFRRPATRFTGTTRYAYLPNNLEGRRLLKRLEYAFKHGLTFTVGDSLTTRAKNTVIWSTIHHRTSRTAGPFGYPDLGYIYNCNEELDRLGVPPADDL